MRLAVFTNQYPARISTFFARDLRALIEAGIEVEVFPIYPCDESLWAYVPEILNESILPRERVHHLSLASSMSAAIRTSRKAPAGFTKDVLRLGAEALRAGPAQLAKSLYGIPKAYAWAEQHQGRFDHILGYWGNYPATCAYAFQRLDGRPIPYSIFLHAGTDLYRERPFLRQKLLAARHVITCSAFNRAFILDQYPDLQDQLAKKLTVYHHGLDFSEMPFRAEGRESERILAVGRLAREKGFDQLLLALSQLKEAAPQASVEILGDGPEMQALSKQAGRLDLKDRVIFRGWTSFQAVQEAMQRATLLVHPSPVIGDGVPNVLKEAAAAGIPIIATDISGLPEAVEYGRSGLLVPPGDPHALAQAIQQLLERPDLRRELALRARRYAERKFDLWENGRELARLLCSG